MSGSGSPTLLSSVSFPSFDAVAGVIVAGFTVKVSDKVRFTTFSVVPLTRCCWSTMVGVISEPDSRVWWWSPGVPDGSTGRVGVLDGG